MFPDPEPAPVRTRGTLWKPTLTPTDGPAPEEGSSKAAPTSRTCRGRGLRFPVCADEERGRPTQRAAGPAGNCHQPGSEAEPPAQAVVAPWPGRRVRPPGARGPRGARQPSPGPARAARPRRGTPARCAPRLRGAGTHPLAAPGRGPGRAGRRRSAAAAAAAAAAPGPSRGGRGPTPPWMARRLRAEAARAAAAPGGVCGRPARRALTPPARPRPSPEPRPHFHTVLPGPGRAARGQCRPSRPPPFSLRALGGGGAAAVAGGRLSAWPGGPASPGQAPSPTPLLPHPRPAPALRASEPRAPPVCRVLQLDPVRPASTNSTLA